MNDQLKNIIIGVFVIAAFAIIVFILLFLHPSAGDEAQTLHVRFSDIDKVNVGTRVTFAGKAVGEVTAIHDVEEGREGPHDDFGHVYIYELTLAVDSGVEVYDTDEISLRTSGLLGERSVAIIPRALQKGVMPHLVGKNEVLYATESGSVEQTMQEFKNVANKIEIAFENISRTLDEIRNEEIVKNVGATALNLVDITDALNKPEEIAAIVNNMRDFTSKTNEIAVHLGKGEGTFGKLLMEKDVYLETKALLAKANTVANDVNHYGLLFHLDKGWQRVRARRMNLLQRLASPEQFRNYFNDEVDQINTSISRVAMVLDQISCYCYPYCYLDNPEFSKVFAELLRSIESIEESIKMYNEQLLDCEAQKTELTGCAEAD